MAVRRHGDICVDAARRAWLLAALLAMSLTSAPAPAQEESAATEHFLIYAQAGASERQAQRIGKLAERAFGRVTGDLGHVPAERIAILVYGQPAGFLDQGAPPHAVGTVTTPHNVIRIDLWRSQHDLYTVVAHEIAHVVLARALRSAVDECPRWFNEGVATWVSQIWTPNDDAEAVDLAQSGRAVPPDELNSRFSGSEREIRDAYTQSAAMVEHLTRVAGTGVIASVLAELRGAPDFDSALRDTVGLTQYALYDRWLRESGGRSRWPRWTLISENLVFFGAVTALSIILGVRIWLRRRRWAQQRPDEEGLTPEEIERAREIEESYRSRPDDGDVQ